MYKFLEILGVKDSIHEETEKIEHTINYDTLEKMETLINFFSKYQGIYSLLKEFQEDKHLDT
ncbi:MAG: iron dependent repressor, metal binding and dimerization domain protein [Intestinibacter sp.]